MKTHTSIQLHTQPELPQAGREVTLLLQPDPSITLDTAHEKKMHLIVVSDDLSYFDHLHPEEEGNAYRVSTILPHGGTFYLFADYTPVGGEQTVDVLTLQAEGAKPVAQHYHSEKLTGTSGAYSLSLSAEGPFTAGHMAITGTLKKDGKQADPAGLDDYLGAKAHVVLISTEGKDFLHVHPEVQNGRYVLHTTFPKPGIYRGWIQFQAEGRLHTTDYVLDVQPSAGGREETSHGHHH